MLSHVAIATNNLDRATAFYDAVLAPLGVERIPSKYEKWAAWQRPGEAPKLWVSFPYNRLPASWGTGWMAAFTAPTRAAVDAAYAAAMARLYHLIRTNSGGSSTVRRPCRNWLFALAHRPAMKIPPSNRWSIPGCCEFPVRSGTFLAM